MAAVEPTACGMDSEAGDGSSMDERSQSKDEHRGGIDCDGGGDGEGKTAAETGADSRAYSQVLLIEYCEEAQHAFPPLMQHFNAERPDLDVRHLSKSVLSAMLFPCTVSAGILYAIGTFCFGCCCRAACCISRERRQRCVMGVSEKHDALCANSVIRFFAMQAGRIAVAICCTVAPMFVIGGIIYAIDGSDDLDSEMTWRLVVQSTFIYGVEYIVMSLWAALVDIVKQRYHTEREGPTNTLAASSGLKEQGLQQTEREAISQLLNETKERRKKYCSGGKDSSISFFKGLVQGDSVNFHKFARIAELNAHLYMPPRRDNILPVGRTSLRDAVYLHGMITGRVNVADVAIALSRGVRAAAFNPFDVLPT
mmetsp:Transcript_96431/g.234405  ORF Transcript_96431/g.234405 Transcript_96431/m.234405 type:complete len:367 (-) Transcript_96431:128-1228(-)